MIFHRSSSDISAQTASRISWIDTAKGYTIILVVMMHSTLGVAREMPGPNFMLAMVDFAQPFRIPAFFLLSGLLLTRAIGRPWRAYLDNKVIHFIYFYVLWLTIQFAFKAPGLAHEAGWEETFAAYLTAYVQPFGTLWFIYLLPVFFVAAKLLRPLPVFIVLPVLALLEIAPIETGAVVIDEFCNRFVYFYAGFAFHSLIFKFSASIFRRPWPHLVWIAGLATLNFLAASERFSLMPSLSDGGLPYASLPLVSLFFGVSGSLALISIAVMTTKLKLSEVFERCGQNSLVIYLAFFLPMAAARTLLVKTGAIPDAGLVSLLVTLIAVIVPLLLHALIKRTGYGGFLFERPAFAQLTRAHSPAG